MIASLATVKSILGYTDTTHDARITTMLPIVEADLIEYCNNRFLNTDISFGGSCTITASAGVYKIVCADLGMDEVSFAENDIVYLDGSTRNDGYYTISAIAAGEITIAEALVAQATASGMTLSLAEFPQAIQLSFARMIGYQVEHANDAGMQSEHIGKYSYSRQASTNADGYPDEILKALNKWRNVSVPKGVRRDQYNDRRGSWVPGKISDNWVRRVQP
jgi:hypothetical protein